MEVSGHVRANRLLRYIHAIRAVSSRLPFTVHRVALHTATAAKAARQ